MPFDNKKREKSKEKKENLFPHNLAEAIPPRLRLNSHKGPTILIKPLLRTSISLLTPVGQNLQILTRQQRSGVSAGVEALKVVLAEGVAQLVDVVLADGGGRARLKEALELPLLDNESFKTTLGVGLLEECLLDCALRREPVDDDRFGLADAVRAVLSLQVLLRVPVGVEEDDRVRGDEVDALAAGAGAQQEELVGGV